MPRQERKVLVLGISRVNLLPVDHVRLTVLVEDSVSPKRSSLTAKHGLSFFVETSVAGAENRILMDAGPPPDVALRNADILRINLQQTDAIVISHGHYDHAGGLIEILKHTPNSIPVVAHPLIFGPKFTFKPNLKFIGSAFDRATVTAAGGILLLARNPVRIASGVMTTGEVERVTNFEQSERFWKVEDEHFVEDSMVDDQALLINVKNKGLVVITGCAHAGIINTLRHAKKATGINDVYAIAGGMHLMNANDNRIQATLDELVPMNPQRVYPCHCTGSKATQRLLGVFNYCKPIQTGDIINL
jgi:7,8-dihydropterin-6-yl-methyl-4-(beta-D-ribofuranosyl)aminobenzene 5'-phosphate synthase